MPEAAPRFSGGQEFMTEAMFGDMNMPFPKPMMNSIMANEG